MKCTYTKPESTEVSVILESGLLQGSITTNSSTGESVTIDSEYDPW